MQLHVIVESPCWWQIIFSPSLTTLVLKAGSVYQDVVSWVLMSSVLYTVRGGGSSWWLPPLSGSIGGNKFQGYNHISHVLVVYPSTGILSCHICCHYSPQPRLCDTCIKKIICIAFNINFFFWWENIACYVLFFNWCSKMASCSATHASCISSLSWQTRACFWSL